KWRHAKPDNIACDLVDRCFSRASPNQLWVTDITEHPTREGKVYCCVVLDAYSRRVVGWPVDASPTAALVTSALGMAIDNRRPSAGALIHSDQGTQFASWVFTDRARASGLVPSMGSVGDCYDNAMIESFWSRMQVELLNTRSPSKPVRLRGRGQAQLPTCLLRPGADVHARSPGHKPMTGSEATCAARPRPAGSC